MGIDIYMDKSLTLRINEDTLKDIREVLKKQKIYKYSSVSHFIRCAVMKLVKEETEILNFE